MTRVTLEPLRVEHAEEMVAVLADPSLYAFAGGAPPSLAQLRARYAAQVAGGGEGERWLNWVVREVASGVAVGYVQATVRGPEASIAWVIRAGYQGRGFAGDAVLAMIELLRAEGVERLRADIHPDHAASAAVARRAGLSPTDEVVDGEIRWVGRLGDN
jgi:RimJ/RimL family protein N-acetyltransferase